jgi:hypothetical protein
MCVRTWNAGFNEAAMAEKPESELGEARFK